MSGTTALPAPNSWVCIAADGNVDHDWRYHTDWDGDPGVINGTRDFGWWECRGCGEIDNEREPPDYEPDLDDYYDSCGPNA